MVRIMACVLEPTGGVHAAHLGQQEGRLVVGIVHLGRGSGSICPGVMRTPLVRGGAYAYASQLLFGKLALL